MCTPKSGTDAYGIWLLRQFFCQVQLFPANYSSKFKDRVPSEKKTSFNQVHLGTVFANLFVPKLHVYHAGDA